MLAMKEHSLATFGEEREGEDITYSKAAFEKMKYLDVSYHDDEDTIGTNIPFRLAFAKHFV